MERASKSIEIRILLHLKLRLDFVWHNLTDVSLINVTYKFVFVTCSWQVFLKRNFWLFIFFTYRISNWKSFVKSDVNCYLTSSLFIFCVFPAKLLARTCIVAHCTVPSVSLVRLVQHFSSFPLSVACEKGMRCRSVARSWDRTFQFSTSVILSTTRLGGVLACFRLCNGICRYCTCSFTQLCILC
jgi:hypothetical protein